MILTEPAHYRLEQGIWVEVVISLCAYVVNERNAAPAPAEEGGVAI
jgi:hypothetical protein